MKNLLKTTFIEIKVIENLRTSLEVKFYEESMLICCLFCLTVFLDLDGMWFFVQVPLENIFYSYGDVPIAGERLQILTNTPQSLSRRVLQRAKPTVTRANRFLWSSPRTRNTRTGCRVELAM